MKRAGFRVYCIFFEEANPMCTKSCLFDAEVTVIASAAKKITETTTFPPTKPKSLSSAYLSSNLSPKQ
jgi:hypothetical protein